MARYRLFLGSSPVPLADLDDTVDANALRVEDPVGTVVWGVTPAGVVASIPAVVTPPAYAATMALAAAVGRPISLIVVPGVSGTSAAVTYNFAVVPPSGTIVIIETKADASGTVTATFGTSCHSSGTQATTASHFSTIMFVSDGTQLNEVARTTALA